MAALDNDRRFADAQMIEGLEGRPPVFLGYHSSLMTVGDMAELITLIQEYGDRNGVRWQGGDRLVSDPIMQAFGRTERRAPCENGRHDYAVGRVKEGCTRCGAKLGMVGNG